MDGPEKAPGDAELSRHLSRLIQLTIEEVIELSHRLRVQTESIDVQALVRLSGTLAGLVHQREGTLARVLVGLSELTDGQPTGAAECPGFQLAREDLICGLCGGALEEHGVASDARPVRVPYVFPDASKVPLKHAHTHRPHTEPCLYPLRPDGTCTSYPADPTEAEHKAAFERAPKCKARSRRWVHGARCLATLNGDGSCPEARSHV
jgi:hypothetical protein